VRTHEHIADGLVWRWGMILAWQGNRALVRASTAQNKVEIRVIGPEHTRREMLALIRGHFEAIHRTFTEGRAQGALEIHEFICPPQYPGLRLNYRDLLTYEKERVGEIQPVWNGRLLRLNVSELLNGFVEPEARRKEVSQMEKSIHVEIHGDLKGSNVVIGNENTIQQHIEHSFNTPSNPDLAPLLAQLTQAVEEMLKHLPAEQAQEARDDLKRLQEELQKPQPRKKWYSVSIKGLIQAAKNVGAIGGPVIELAGKILKLLA